MVGMAVAEILIDDRCKIAIPVMRPILAAPTVADYDRLAYAVGVGTNFLEGVGDVSV